MTPPMVMESLEPRLMLSAAGIPGDLNGDGNVDNLDIAPFVISLTDSEAAFETAFPNGSYWAGDVNEDGNVDNLDISPFVDLLAGGEGPAPGSVVTAQVETFEGGLQLVVIGTDGTDVITLSQSGSVISMTTLFGTSVYDGPFAQVQVYGFAGADTIRLTHDLSVDSLLYAGDGNDSIFEAGGGAATLYGEAGADLLVSVGGVLVLHSLAMQKP